MPFGPTWVDPEIITLSELNQRQILYDITYTWNVKNDINEVIYKIETHRYRKQSYRYQRAKLRGGSMGLTDTHHLCKIDKQWVFTVEHMELYSISCNNQ